MVYTNLSHESLLSFVWMKFLRIRETVIWEELRKHKSSSLGMPRMASPLSSSFIGNFTWSYIFIRHMIYVFLGASINFVRICLMLFRTMFCIFYFNKSGIDSLYYAYFRSPHVVVWKQKVYRCCNNSLEKSECDKMLKTFPY